MRDYSSSQPNSMKSSRVRESPSRNQLNPQEESLQALCKQILKSRLFRGYYIERRYVDSLQGYRDIVALENGEREMHNLLVDIRQRVLQFYWQTSPRPWFGITAGKLNGAPGQLGAMDTFIWTELNELAYGQYWFSIKTIRFRENEILLKLKMVRLVENEGREATLRRCLYKNPTVLPAANAAPHNSTLNASEAAATAEAKSLQPPEPQIGLQDFVQLAQRWGNSIKHSIFNFLSNDITKQNIVEFLRFMALLIVSLASGGVYALKFLGHFTLRFMYELSRLTHVLTPIIIKIIEVINKAIGGFYILLTMVWKDTVYKRAHMPTPMLGELEPQHRTTTYKSIEYNVHSPPSSSQQQPLHHHHAGSSTTSSVQAHFGEFERKFPM